MPALAQLDHAMIGVHTPTVQIEQGKFGLKLRVLKKNSQTLVDKQSSFCDYDHKTNTAPDSRG
jgi:hypothetical protein